MTLLAAYAGGFVVSGMGEPGLGYTINDIGHSIYGVYELTTNPLLQPFTNLYAWLSEGGRIIRQHPAELEWIARDNGLLHMVWHLPSQVALWIVGGKALERIRSSSRRTLCMY